MNTCITINNLVKKYGKKLILKNVSFQMDAGKIYGFIGPNGAGKTTTLKCILGLTNYESGEIKMRGIPISNKPSLENIGYLQDVPEFFNQMTGLEYLELFRRMEINQMETFINEFQLEEFISDPIRTYSLGMKKKLGMALAFWGEPECVFLDEPFTGLDPFMMVEVRELLKKMKSKKYTICISSHILSELEHLCDHFIMIHKGKIILDSSSKDLFEQYVKIPKEKLKNFKENIQNYVQYKDFIFVRKDETLSFLNKTNHPDFQTPNLEELFMLHAKKE